MEYDYWKINEKAAFDVGLSEHLRIVENIQ